jgi:hypothetical protein
MTLEMRPATSEDIMTIFNTGAKYIGRANFIWEAPYEYRQQIAEWKNLIDVLHSIDPEILFETGIFEVVWKSCELLPIPAWVFEAFGLEPERRNFNHDKMLFPDGRFVNHSGDGSSIPDIMQLETQMYFYYRACRYIDAGFEVIHWGNLILWNDIESANGYQNWHRLLTMVREYARENARRGMVLNNAHTHGAIGPDGKLLFDFHGWGLYMITPDEATAHPPSEDNPQTVILLAENSIYNNSLGGTTVSGWTTESLPFFVEFDNYGGYFPGYLNKPERVGGFWDGSWPWGMDEVSWFANQPKWYRHEFIDYAYNWVRETDTQGFLMMSGVRYSYMQDINDMTHYSAYRWGDVEAIRDVWIRDNQ